MNRSRPFKTFMACLTVVTFLTTGVVWAPESFATAPTVNVPVPASSEMKLPYQTRLDPGIQFSIPQELGTLQYFKPGKGPMVVHLQTAHGHYQAQQQIRALLHYLDKQYGIKTLLVEGSAFKLQPEILDFFPEDPKLTQKVNDALTQAALVKGPELYLLDELSATGKKNPVSAPQAYGIENLEAYRANGLSFVDVLKEKKKTEKFLASMNEGIERLSAAYLNDTLRGYLKQLESFENNRLPVDAWLSILKKEALKRLKLDLAQPAAQLDWPMLIRVFKIQELSAQFNKDAFVKEREGFLKALRRFLPQTTFAQVETLLKSETQSVQLPDPETSMLFEDMVKTLPRDFAYETFPNVRYFIGRLLLQSELKAPELMEEAQRLSAKITDKLAKTKAEKALVGLLKDHRLLQKLFALELTPSDYELIAGDRIKPSEITKRFKQIGSVSRVRDVNFTHLADLDALFNAAMKFYAGVKERDGMMERMIEKRLTETGTHKVAVITGGFHSEPFKDYFSSKDYSYALIAPRIAGGDEAGHQAYVENMMKFAQRTTGNAQREPQKSPASSESEATRELEFLSDPQLLSGNAYSVNAAAVRAEVRRIVSEVAGRSEVRKGPIAAVSSAAIPTHVRESSSGALGGILTTSPGGMPRSEVRNDQRHENGVGGSQDPRVESLQSLLDLYYPGSLREALDLIKELPRAALEQVRFDDFNIDYALWVWGNEEEEEILSDMAAALAQKGVYKGMQRILEICAWSRHPRLSDQSLADIVQALASQSQYELLQALFDQNVKESSQKSSALAALVGYPDLLLKIVEGKEDLVRMAIPHIRSRELMARVIRGFENKADISESSELTLADAEGVRPAALIGNEKISVPVRVKIAKELLEKHDITASELAPFAPIFVSVFQSRRNGPVPRFIALWILASVRDLEAIRRIRAGVPGLFQEIEEKKLSISEPGYHQPWEDQLKTETVLHALADAGSSEELLDLSHMEKLGKLVAPLLPEAKSKDQIMPVNAATIAASTDEKELFEALIAARQFKDAKNIPGSEALAVQALEHPDRRIRAQAARYLVHIGADKAVPQLMRWLDNYGISSHGRVDERSVREALVNFKDYGGVPGLLAKLKSFDLSNDPPFLIAYWIGLAGEVGDPVLTEYVKTFEGEFPMWDFGWGFRTDGGDDVSILIEQQQRNKDEWHLVQEAVRTVLKKGTAARSEQRWMPEEEGIYRQAMQNLKFRWTDLFLWEKETRRRVDAVKSLGTIENPAIVPALHGLLAKEDREGVRTDVWFAIASLLLQKGETHVLETVIDSLLKDIPVVRERAARFLGENHVASAVPALTLALKDSYGRLAAAEAIEKITGSYPLKRKGWIESNVVNPHWPVTTVFASWGFGFIFEKFVILASVKPGDSYYKGVGLLLLTVGSIAAIYGVASVVQNRIIGLDRLGRPLRSKQEISARSEIRVKLQSYFFTLSSERKIGESIRLDWVWPQTHEMTILISLYRGKSGKFLFDIWTNSPARRGGHTDGIDWELEGPEEAILSVFQRLREPAVKQQLQEAIEHDLEPGDFYLENQRYETKLTPWIEKLLREEIVSARSEIRRIKKLGGWEIRALEPEAIASLTAKEIRALSRIQLLALTEKQVGEFTAEQLQAFTGEQREGLEGTEQEKWMAARVDAWLSQNAELVESYRSEVRSPGDNHKEEEREMRQQMRKDLEPVYEAFDFIDKPGDSKQIRTYKAAMRLYVEGMTWQHTAPKRVAKGSAAAVDPNGPYAPLRIRPKKGSLKQVSSDGNAVVTAMMTDKELEDFGVYNYEALQKMKPLQRKKYLATAAKTSVRWNILDGGIGESLMREEWLLNKGLRARVRSILTAGEKAGEHFQRALKALREAEERGKTDKVIKALRELEIRAALNDILTTGDTKVDPKYRKALANVRKAEEAGEASGILAALGKLAELTSFKPLQVKMGAKSTDLGRIETIRGNEYFVGDAELRFLFIADPAINRQFGKIIFQPIVNDQSMVSYEKLLKEPYLWDVIEGRYKSGTKNYRTYEEALKDAGVEIPEMLVSTDLPKFEIEADPSVKVGFPTTDAVDKRKRQTGGHGQPGVYFMVDFMTNEPVVDKAHPHAVMFFSNGDNNKAVPDPLTVGAVVEEEIPILKLVTPATPIDRKGGKEVVRIIQLPNNGNGERKVLNVLDQWEEIDAKKANQAKTFYDAGQRNGFGKEGKQLFNLNAFYFNIDLLHPILDAMRESVGPDEFLDGIMPLLFDKSDKAIEFDGKKYVSMDSALGYVVHKLNTFYMTEPRFAELRKQYGDQLLYYMNHDRSIFAPKKGPGDQWLQEMTDYYGGFQEAIRNFRDAEPELTPPGIDFTDPYEKDGNPADNKFWIEAQHWLDSLGFSRVRQLRSFKAEGRFTLRNGEYIGDIVIINRLGRSDSKKRAERVILSSGKYLDQLKALGFWTGDHLRLENVQLTIDEEGGLLVEKMKAVRTQTGALKITDQDKPGRIERIFNDLRRRGATVYVGSGLQVRNGGVLTLVAEDFGPDVNLHIGKRVVIEGVHVNLRLSGSNTVSIGDNTKFEGLSGLELDMFLNKGEWLRADPDVLQKIRDKLRDPSTVPRAQIVDDYQEHVNNDELDDARYIFSIVESILSSPLRGEPVLIKNAKWVREEIGHFEERRSRRSEMREDRNPLAKPIETVLLVDDQVDFVTPLGKLIGRDGFKVTVAHSGQEALEKLNTLTPDAIVTDILMPGMTGYEWVLEAVKKRPELEHVAIVFMSGYVSDKTAFNKAVDALAPHYPVHFLAKPFPRADLTALLKEPEKRFLHWPQRSEVRGEPVTARGMQSLVETITRQEREIASLRRSIVEAKTPQAKLLVPGYERGIQRAQQNLMASQQQFLIAAVPDSDLLTQLMAVAPVQTLYDIYQSSKAVLPTDGKVRPQDMLRFFYGIPRQGEGTAMQDYASELRAFLEQNPASKDASSQSSSVSLKSLETVREGLVHYYKPQFETLILMTHTAQGLSREALLKMLFSSNVPVAKSKRPANPALAVARAEFFSQYPNHLLLFIVFLRNALAPAVDKRAMPPTSEALIQEAKLLRETLATLRVDAARRSKFESQRSEIRESGLSFRALPTPNLQARKIGAGNVSIQNGGKTFIAPEVIQLIEHYYFKIVPMRLYREIAAAGGREALLETLRKVVGIPVSLAADEAVETDVLGALFAPEVALGIPEGAGTVSGTANESVQALTNPGAVFLGQDLLGKLIEENPRALFYLLKGYAAFAKDKAPAFLTVGSRDLILRISAALTQKNSGLTGLEFSERSALLQDLKAGKVLQVIEPAQGASEAQVINGLAAKTQGGLASLHLSAAMLPGLTDGVHFAFGETIGAGDLMVASVLAIVLKSAADLIRNVPDPHVRAELLNKFIWENLPGAHPQKQGGNAFVITQIARLAQEFVAQARIAVMA